MVVVTFSGTFLVPVGDAHAESISINAPVSNVFVVFTGARLNFVLATSPIPFRGERTNPSVSLLLNPAESTS